MRVFIPNSPNYNSVKISSMLYIVPTPIGNLEDITLRALRILKEVDLVLAEDTRTTKKLFDHYQIETPLQSHHIHNEHHKTPLVISDLEAEKNIALVSDAGTPAISDPGFLLVREAAAQDIPITVLPGATAIVPALVGAAIPCDKFYFEGFLPHKKGRKTRLEFLAELPTTFALYESPYRLEKCIRQLSEHCGGERQAAICREISKLHEQFARGTLDELLEKIKDKSIPTKGEIVIVVEGAPKKKKKKKYKK